VGIQFEVDIEHAVYNTSKIAVSPLTWTEVFSSGVTYMFPAAGQDGLVNDAFLIQYLSTGAQLVDHNDNPALDQQALKDVLEFYRQGLANGSILPDVLDYATVETGWPKYLQAEVVMSNISSKLYLAGPGSLPGNRPAAVPTRDGQAIALGRGYAWALTTRDPNRQSFAVKLLEWLMYPPNVAAWSQAAEHLPTRRVAFEVMGRDPYAEFIHSQLEFAIPYPYSETHQRIYRAMQQAIDAVLREGVLSDVAAENVLKAVNQERSP
jgi:ABC-type glycerol-3-phosphate transport system substrate-binding protein